MPISQNGMTASFRIRPVLALAVLFACLGHSQAARNKSRPEIPTVVPAPKLPPAAAMADSASGSEPADLKPGDSESSDAAFQELQFNRTLIIEGKVEKPAVQFTLLKEPPPEKEIRFEASFMQNILKLDRENTFKAGETYGKE
jgi:hypothetical protein